MDAQGTRPPVVTRVPWVFVNVNGRWTNRPENWYEGLQDPSELLREFEARFRGSTDPHERASCRLDRPRIRITRRCGAALPRSSTPLLNVDERNFVTR